MDDKKVIGQNIQNMLEASLTDNINIAITSYHKMAPKEIQRQSTRDQLLLVYYVALEYPYSLYSS